MKAPITAILAILLWDAKSQCISIAPEKITWNNYKGEPDPKLDFVALTYVTLEIKTDTNKKGAISIKSITSKFCEDKSWYRAHLSIGVPQWAQDALFTHELYHYKLDMAFAKQLKESIPPKRLFTVQQYKQFEDSVVAKRREFINKYDIETDHARNMQQQTLWVNKIDKILKE